MTNKIAIIGDIHGHSEALRSLLGKIRAEHGDIDIYCTGDLCDRGPDSPGVVQICIDNAIRSVLGNHDEWLVKTIGDNKIEALRVYGGWTYGHNGGVNTLVQYGVEIDRFYDQMSVIERLIEKVPQSHKDYLRNLPICIETDHCYITHAGALEEKYSLKPGSRPFEVGGNFEGLGIWSTDDLIWSRPSDIMDPQCWQVFNKPQVCGHTDRAEPLVGTNYIGIDTGSGKEDNGKLTAVIMPDQEFISVNANL